MSLINLTKNQTIAIEHYKGPALTLAIPGSGKTTLLLHRLIYLVEVKGVLPNQILTLTFSKASAEDMSLRYAQQFSQLHPYDFAFMTIHKFAFSIIKSYMKQTHKTYTLFNDANKRFAVISQIYRKYNHVAMTEEQYESILNAFGLIYNLQLKRGDANPELPDMPYLFEMMTEYHLFKKKNNYIDFDDMLIYAIKILDQNPSAKAFYQRQFPFIQIDEAQDTSKLQYTFIEKLLTPSQNLFLVADDDQSIYGFRGAYPDYLLNFQTIYPKAKCFYLEINYRSDANIVAASSGIISKNQHRFKKTMTSFHETKKPPYIKTFDDIISRNAYIVENIEAFSGTTAILFRNRISALSLMNQLEFIGIPYYMKESPLVELNHWMLEDIKAFFSLSMIPQDSDAFKRIAFKMNGYISREMLVYSLDHQNGRSLLDVLIEIPFLEPYQSKTQERIKSQFENLSKLRPYDAIAFIETELGYLDYLKKNQKKMAYTMNFARTRLDIYKAIAKPLKTPYEFIARIAELKDILSVQKMPEAVTLSTIHGAKGLEFDRVFLIDVNEQVFPGPSNDSIEEERRLFYVAMTRAKSNFELLHCEFVNGTYNPASLFIEELLIQKSTEHLFNNRTGKSAIG